ncbi:hypothetical protein BDZ45DRAFT_796575 [Acephala macrosclerotiorum]|nr:hypothetical protein BDZ45DRAFT_796575 [Acephala macrosclerotiorum]
MTCPAASTLPTSLLNNVALIAGSQGQVPVMLALDNCCLSLTSNAFKWSANNCYHYCNITSLAVATSMNNCIHDKLSSDGYDFNDYDWAFPNDYGFTLPVNTKPIVATPTDTGGIIFWVNPGGGAPTQYINSPMIFFPESTSYNHAPSTSNSDTPKTTSLSYGAPNPTASLLESILSPLILGPGNATKIVTSQSTSIRAATGTTITLLASNPASSISGGKPLPAVVASGTTSGLQVLPAVVASGTTSTGSNFGLLPVVVATGATSAGTVQSSSVAPSMSIDMSMSMPMPMSSGSAISLVATNSSTTSASSTSSSSGTVSKASGTTGTTTASSPSKSSSGNKTKVGRGVGFMAVLLVLGVSA